MQGADISFAPDDEDLLEKNHYCDIDAVHIKFHDKNNKPVTDKNHATLSDMYIWTYGRSNIVLDENNAV